MSELPLGTDLGFGQRKVDWPAAWKAGVRFAFIRWGQRRDWLDSRAPYNWAESRKTPIFRGAYWVWDERDGHDAGDHVRGVLDSLQEIGLWTTGYDGELPFAADLELRPVHWEELKEWLIWLEGWSGRRPIIYTGAWFYEQVEPLPEWLKQYDHWLTGYNDQGPTITGATAELNPPVVIWQQANNWQVSWAESGAVDRDYWWAGWAHLWRNADMTKKVINVDELLAFIQEKAYDADPVPGSPTKFRLHWPTAGPVIVTQAYGINAQHYSQFGLKGHEGIDIRAPNGTPILAAARGRVYRVETNPASGAYGIHVRIQHDHPDGPFKTVYAHFERATVAEGDQVEAGQQIGLADNTGNSSGAHLHLTLKKDGDGSEWMATGDIVNPTPYLLDLFPGNGWLVDVAGNLRRHPDNDPASVIRLARPGETFKATGLFTGDWWELEIGGGTLTAWFWNPGYKLRAL